MPDRQKKKPFYSEKQATRWLSWLARGMQRHGQTVFLIEQLQPSWLSSRRQLTAYGLASRLAVGIPLGLIVGVVLILLGFSVNLGSKGEAGQILQDPEKLLSMAGFVLMFVLVLAALPALFLGCGAAILDLWRLRGRGVWVLPDRFGERWRSTVYIVIYQGALTLLGYAILTLIAALVALGWSFTGKDSAAHTTLWILLLITAIMIFLAPFPALIGSALWGTRAARQDRERDISTVETLGWSWAAARKGVLQGLVHGSGSLLLLCLSPFLFPMTLLMGAAGAGTGLVLGFLPRVTVRKAVWSAGKFGLLGGLLIGLCLVAGAVVVLGFMSPSKLALVAGVMALCGLCGGVCGGVFNGLQSKVVAIKTLPNQGMRLSLKNALAGAGLVALPFGFLGGVAGLSLDLLPATTKGTVGTYGIFVAFSAALVAGLFGGLWYGGVDWLYHVVLRLVLFSRGALPLRLSRFLDYAADELNFLQKVGGGYMFIHRYLQEHFAALEETAADATEKAAEPAAALAAAS